MYALAVHCILLLLSLSCVVSQFEEGRTEDELATFVTRHPYIVNIRSAQQSVCTGVLIGNYTILTAAECVDPRRRVAFNPPVWLNATRTEELTESVLVRQTVETVLHPNYTGSAIDGYNIAVLRLDQSAAPLRPIRILPESLDVTVGPETRPLSVLGFGRTSLFGARTLVLQIGEVIVLDPELCIEAGIGYLEDIMFCVDSALPCSGDQGGPVFVDNGNPQVDILFGLISGTSCSENVDLSGVTHLATPEARVWIRQTRDMLDLRGRMNDDSLMAEDPSTSDVEAEVPSPEMELDDLFLDYP